MPRPIDKFPGDWSRPLTADRPVTDRTGQWVCPDCQGARKDEEDAIDHARFRNHGMPTFVADRPIADREHIGVHRAGYRSDCPACVANDERISARPIADREPLSEYVVEAMDAPGLWQVRRWGGIVYAGVSEDEARRAADNLNANSPRPAARAHPDEAGLRLAVGDLHRWDERKGWPAFNAILARIDAALAQPPVPVAGAEDWYDRDAKAFARAHAQTAALRAAQPEDDGLSEGVERRDGA